MPLSLERSCEQFEKKQLQPGCTIVHLLCVLLIRIKARKTPTK